MRKYRFLQLITGVHYIHHWYYSFGWKLPFIEVGYFLKHGWRKTNKSNLKDKDGIKIDKPYHDCTKTNIY